MSVRKPRITDEMILHWIEAGILWLDGMELWFRGRKIKAELVRQGGRRYSGAGEQCERWAWGLRFNGLRRKIVRSKLVWMVAHKRIVPDGHELHHVDDDRLNDAIDNLALLTSEQHSFLHNPCQQEF